MCGYMSVYMPECVHRPIHMYRFRKVGEGVYLKCP